MEFLKGIVNLLAKPEVLITTSMIVLLDCSQHSRALETSSCKNSVCGRRRTFSFLAFKIQTFEKSSSAPDNVPIVGMLFLVGFFVWYALYKAKANDDRLDQSLPVKEAEDNEKVLVWPNLVYTEMICLVICSAILNGLGNRVKSAS